MFPTNKTPAPTGTVCQRVQACEGTAKERKPVWRCGKPAETTYVYPDGMKLHVCLMHDIIIHGELRTIMSTPIADKLLWRHA